MCLYEKKYSVIFLITSEENKSRATFLCGWRTSLLTKCRLPEIRWSHRESWYQSLLWFCYFFGLRKILGLMFKQIKGSTETIISFYLKVLKDEWQNSQKFSKSLKITKLKNFLKNRMPKYLVERWHHFTLLNCQRKQKRG